MPTTSYPRDDSDVAGDFVRSMARALVRRGHEVEVLAPEPSIACARPDEAGIRVRYVPYARPRHLSRTFYGAGVPDNVARDPLAWLGLVTYPPMLAAALAGRIGRWDAVVSHWALPSAIAVGAVRRTRPHVSVLHSADVHLLAALPARRMLASAIERSASSLWFSVPYLVDRFEHCLGRAPSIPVDVAPMGFDPAPGLDESRASIRKRLGLSGFVVLSMGRLVPIKGVDRVIDACGSLGATLVVAGSGPEEASLRDRARGIDVRFVGTIRGDEKQAYLAAADAFALGSRVVAGNRAEGAPVSLLEAMHAGLPIVATATGGVESLVGDAGLLVPDRDDALAAALARLRDEPSLRTTLAARGRGRSREHTWDERVIALEARLSGA